MTGKKKKSSKKKLIEQYDHKGKKRVNNPPARHGHGVKSTFDPCC